MRSIRGEHLRLTRYLQNPCSYLRDDRQSTATEDLRQSVPVDRTRKPIRGTGNTRWRSRTSERESDAVERVSGKIDSYNGDAERPDVGANIVAVLGRAHWIDAFRLQMNGVIGDLRERSLLPVGRVGIRRRVFWQWSRSVGR